MNRRFVLLMKVSAISLLAHTAHAQDMMSRTITTQTFEYPDQFAPTTETVVRSVDTWQCNVGDGGDGDGGGSSDPLIFDLDNDGIQLLTIAEGVRFDMDNDGIPDRTAWVGPDDAILVVDKNGNNQIDNHSEMFGTETLSGIQDLSRFDSNSDGIIDKDDDIWKDLELWQDRNSDGRSRRSEMLSLKSVGIVSISLEGEIVREIYEDAMVIGKGTASGLGGKITHIFDVIFDFVGSVVEEAEEDIRNLWNDLFR